MNGMQPVKVLSDSSLEKNSDRSPRGLSAIFEKPDEKMPISGPR